MSKQEKQNSDKPKPKVRMRFKENKFYNDLTKPHFLAGKIYTVEGQDMIDRWLKRGGEIVEDESPKALANSLEDKTQDPPAPENTEPQTSSSLDQNPPGETAPKAPVATPEEKGKDGSNKAHVKKNR